MSKKNAFGSSTKLLAIEYAVFRARPQFDGKALGRGHLLVACCSGGADSTAMLEILSRLQKRWGFELRVAYVHHGDSAIEATVKFRAKAERFVRKLAKKHRLQFVGLKTSSRKSDSEEAMRNGRRNVLFNYAKKEQVSALVFGHHADDLLETRLIRLIRGTGPQGLLAMSAISDSKENDIEAVIWRPLLSQSRVEIEHYLKTIGQRKIEDPSNRDDKVLRNAIRRKLIPLIDRIRPGGANSLARSLELLAEYVAATENRVTARNQRMALDRTELLSLGRAERRRRLSEWIHAQGIRGISSSAIDEILKRIDTPRKRLSFRVGGRVWNVEKTINCVV